MKPSFKFVCVIALLLFITRNSLARPINRIDSFETTSGIIFGIDKYCKIDRTNEYSTDGKFSVKLSFNTNYPNATQNFFLPVMSINKKSDESLLFDVYNKSSDDIILFCKVFLAGNKYVEQSTKLIKHKKTTVEIPFALARENFNTISGYQFRITNSTKNTIIYFDNFRTELSSYIPFKKIAYLDLNNEPLQTNTFFFSRNTSGQVFKDTIPLPFEKVYKIKLFAAKGEELYYSLSFRTCKKQNKVSISLSDFISNNSNKLSLTTSIGKVGYLDKRLSYDSKFFIADMPLYILKGNCFTNLSSKATRTFQFTLNIPDSAIPGTYFANVIFETINGVLTNRNLIPVSLDVYPFSVNKKSLSNNFILNCDLESIKPELNRYASGFFKVIGGSNNIVKSLPQIILGDAFDDFDCDAGDRISVYLTNQISIARYAVNIGNNDLNYFNILKYWLKKARKQKIQSREIDESQDDIKYLINSLKTTPPLNIASKWTAMLTKEQVSLTGVSYDSNAIAFITGEQKLPNGWTAKDYDRARMMIANDIIKLMKMCDSDSQNVNISTTIYPNVSFIESVSIPLSLRKTKKKKKETVYSVRELISMPRIDGKIDKNEWRNSLKIKRFSKISGDNNADIQTEAQLGWYDSNFYILVTCYKNKTFNMKNDSVELFINQGNENKIWNKLSVDFSGKVRGMKSDGKLWKQNINVQSALAPKLEKQRAREKADYCRCVEFAIPLTDCLTHSDDFGLNICRRNDNGFFAWKPFSKSKLKFAHIKLNGADKIIDILIPPLKKQPLKIISSDAFAIRENDVICLETEWKGERKLLKKTKLEFKIIGNDNKEYVTINTKSTKPRQKNYLKLDNFIPGIYKINVNLIDMDGVIISSANTKIKILPCRRR